MSNRLSANNVVELLENEWQNIQKQLGSDWDGFVDAYCKIVNKLPDKPEIEDVESTVDQVCELLCKYKYTRRLLQNLQGEPAEKLLTSPSGTLENSEKLTQICNIVRSLASASRSQKAKENPKGDRKWARTDAIHASLERSRVLSVALFPPLAQPREQRPLEGA